MTPAHLTSLSMNTNRHPAPARHREVRVISAVSPIGGHRATREHLTSPHVYSLPVVRELPSRQVDALAARPW